MREYIFFVLRILFMKLNSVKLLLPIIAVTV